MQFVTLGIIPIVIGMNMLGGLLSDSSTNSALAALNQIQLLILLLVLKVHLPVKVINYLKSLASSLINISIDWSFIPLFKQISEWLDYPQIRDDFDLIDITSGSSLLNLNILIGTLFIYLIVHMICSLVIRLNFKGNNLVLKLITYIHS